MEGIMVSAQSILIMAAVLIAQYFLAKRPQRWLAFILPVVFFVLSIREVFQTVQSGILVYGGVPGTALITFVTSNIITAMLLMVWWKKDFDKATIAIAVFAVYILSNVLLMLLLMLIGAIWA